MDDQLMRKIAVLITAALLLFTFACSSSDDPTTPAATAAGPDAGSDASPTVVNPTMPLPVAVPAGSLAAKIGAAMNGTYAVSCGSAQHTVVVNADGSSTLDGAPVSDATHVGNVQILSNFASIAADQNDASHIGYPGFLLQFDAQGKLSVGSFVKTTSATPVTCTAGSPTFDLTKLDAAKIVGSFARTTTVTCTGNGAPTGPTTFTIGSDGGVSLGSISLPTSAWLPDHGAGFDDAAAFHDFQNAEIVTVGTGFQKIAASFEANAGALKSITAQNNRDLWNCKP